MKRVFQLHWVNMETGEIVVVRLTPAKFPQESGSNGSRESIMSEACGTWVPAPAWTS